MHDFNPLPFSFPLFILLSTSHARRSQTVWFQPCLVLFMFLLSLLLQRCNLRSIFSPSITTHVPPFLLTSSLSFSLWLVLLFLSPPLPSIHIAVYRIPLCTPYSTSRYLPLSAVHKSLLWPSCQLPAPPVHNHTPCTHLHICVYVPMTVWRSCPANSKHKGRLGGRNDRQKVEWAERHGGRDKVEVR